MKIAPHVKFLITGHGRSGTHYLADLFNYYGYCIGGSRMGPDGIAGHQFGHPDMPCDIYCRSNMTWDYLIHGVRNPWHTVESDFIAHGAPSEDHARYVKEIARGNRLERAMASVVIWSRMIESQHPSLVVQVETADIVVPEWLRRMGLPAEPVAERFILHDIPRYSDDLSQPPPKNVNSRMEPHNRKWPSGSVKLDYSTASASLMAEFKAHCRRYGYPEEP